MKLGITFGALAIPIKKQLAEQGMHVPHLAMWQHHADSIAALSIVGLLSDSETHNARRRLLKRIIAITKAVK